MAMLLPRESIKLLSPGVIDGTMSAPRLLVETGGVFNGRVSMESSKTPKMDPVVLFAKEFHKN